jgi:antitoxin component of RelBE/YafQ-DinJ toxin-antitoxin module
MGQKDRVLTVRIDDELSDGLATMTERYGAKISDQLRTALREWLVRHGALATSGPRGKRPAQA